VTAAESAKKAQMTESSIPQGDSKTTPLLQQWLDFLSKGWVPLLAAIYGSGYLIVSIYQASLGLNAINLLRPQVAAAGCMFLAVAAGALFWMRFISRAVIRLGPATTSLNGPLFAVCFGGLYLFCSDFMTTIATLPILSRGRGSRAPVILPPMTSPIDQE
jgi:hypothetical protein